MSFIKNWNEGEKEMVRTKPGIGSNDQLDELAEQEAEWQRTNHEAGECRKDCQYCELDREAKHYQRHVFDRFHDLFITNFKKGIRS